MNDESPDFIMVCEYLYERYEERYFEKQDLSLQVAHYVLKHLRGATRRKNAIVKGSDIRRFVNNLETIHTPLLDRWFNRDCVKVPKNQTECISHDSGVLSLLSISKDEAAALLKESVNERLFDLFYYQFGHYQSCPQGCSAVRYCVWFRCLLDSFIQDNSSQESNPLLTTLRVVLSHKSFCIHESCSLCQHAQDYERAQSQLLSTQSIRVSVISPEQFHAHSEAIHLTHSPVWNSSLRTEIGLILDHIKRVDAAHLFAEPVDIASRGCDEYYQIILDPIDLHTMRQKNARGEYHNIKAFKNDFDRMISNCLEYNYQNKDIIAYAKLVQQFFEKDYCQLENREHSLLEKYRKNHGTRICSVCSGGETLFKPSYLHCDECLCSIEGCMRYVMDASFHHIWCLPCYIALPERIPTGIGDIEKTSLLIREVDETEKEPWVCCSGCYEWFHACCVLMDSCSCSHKFVCPSCVNSLSLNDKLSGSASSLQSSSLPSASPPASSVSPSSSQPSAPSSIPHASSLPSCHLSDFIESRLQTRILEIRQNYASTHNMNIQDTPCPNHLTVRVLCNENRQLPLDDHFLWYFRNMNPPSSLPYNQKCICVFQNHLNVDVLVFVLFVFECPYDCMFNQRTAYISYIDSVTYITPSSFRKVVNQSVIISYLEYLQQKGYNRVSIWICPSTKGDDYIFFSHPPDQHMPTKASLIRWYMELLNEANSRGIVSEVSNLVDMYLTGRFGLPMSDDAILQIPIFQGDYWTKIIESKCKDFFDAGESPFDPTVQLDPKKRKRGKLVVGMYESLRSVKTQLLIISLQHQCQLCGRYLREENHFSLDIPPQSRTTHSNAIPSEFYCCQSCALINLNLTGPRHIYPRTTVHLIDMNPLFTSRIFSDRHVFLGFCQDNHFEFSEYRRALYSSYKILQNCLCHKMQIKPWKCSVVQIDMKNHCDNVILSGYCWLCLECSQFHVCESCKSLSTYPHSFIQIDASTGYSNDPGNDLLLLAMVTPKLSSMKRRNIKDENMDYLVKRDCVL